MSRKVINIPKSGWRKRWDFNSRLIIGPKDNPMLERWRLIQTPLLSIYIHYIYREDLDRFEHDHPWSFWSFVLRGSYEDEVTADARFRDNVPERQQHKRFSLHRMPLRSSHRIMTCAPGTTTLVIVGKAQRRWGFYSPYGWVPHNLEDGSINRIGLESAGIRGE